MLLRFSTPNDLSDFLSRLKREAPDLHGRAKPSYSQPTVLTVRFSSAWDEERLRALVQPSVKIFADVEFGTL